VHHCGLDVVLCDPLQTLHKHGSMHGTVGHGDAWSQRDEPVACAHKVAFAAAVMMAKLLAWPASACGGVKISVSLAQAQCGSFWLRANSRCQCNSPSGEQTPWLFHHKPGPSLHAT
jgi:hypothetical protein